MQQRLCQFVAPVAYAFWRGALGEPVDHWLERRAVLFT
jgi:hypothetical protein